jgi:excisionase family DNA binding protein
MAPKWLSYKDLSERLQIPVNTLRIWVMEKKLIPVKFGRLVRFSESYIQELEAKGRDQVAVIVEKYNDRLKCKLYFVRIRNEEGKKQLFTPGHTSKTVAREYQRKLINEIAEKKMFHERNVKKWLFKDFMAEYIKHMLKISDQPEIIKAPQKY